MTSTTTTVAGNTLGPEATDSVLIKGGRPLHGEVRVSGFKHVLVTVIGRSCRWTRAVNNHQLSRSR